MAKAYRYENEKTRWAMNVASGLRRYAEKSRCPKCDRKNAYHRMSMDFEFGLIAKKCRYCGYKTVYRLESGLTEETWVGSKTCDDCERRDRHHHCGDCGSTKHGAANCDNLG